MNRKGFIGGSDCVKIMQGKWLELWQVKTGREQPEDLTHNLAVQLGTITEDFKYSTSQLLDKKKNREVLVRIANDKNLDVDAIKVLKLIQKWNAGLMQELYFE